MKRYALQWFVVLLVALLVPGAASGQDWKGRVDLDGTATNPEGQGLPETVVTAIFLETGTGPDPETANNSGKFDLDDLKPGMWQITIAAGHLGYGAEILEIEVKPRDNDDIEVVLEPLQTMLDRANAAYTANNFADSREDYLKILVALPDNVNLHQPIALAYQGEGMDAEALDHFDALLAGWDGGAPPPTPGAPADTRLQAMLSAGAAGEYERMHGYIDSLGGALPADAETAFIDVSANTLMEAEHYEEAVKVLDKAVERWPSSALPYYYRGMSHVQLENDDQAVDDLTKFVELSPSESPQVRQANDVLAKLAPQQ